ncbi:unnamed protein product [Calicophoron daubneyi]|uniref:Dynein regulatory complex protein 9 n=1 Tax=Calicophoron daubneyi TaxID=300641 RepID=A0AAV2TX65_CALDB
MDPSDSPKAEQLEGSEALAVCTVLADTILELKTLLNIIDLEDSSINHASKPTDYGRDLIIRMNKVLSNYACSTAKQKLSKMNRQCNNSAFVDYTNLETTIEDSFNSEAYNQKLCSDISQVIDIMATLKDEISQSGTISTLEEVIKKKEEGYKEVESILATERSTRNKILLLKKEIKQKTKDGQELVEKSRETIAHLKDQVQEIKAKTIMEEKYFTKYSAVKLSQAERFYQAQEQKIMEEISRLSLANDQERRVHEETMSYLADRVTELNAMREYWQERSQKNVSDLKHKLGVLKLSKERDAAHFQELSEQYREYEAVVLADRIAKEKERQQKEQAELELQASIKIQSWWRTLVIRRNLGSHDKRRRKGRRGGRKGGKKGKKGKK